MRFDLTDLRLFMNVADAGSITAGALRSHIALAAASARIRGMEETLGVALLVRGRRGIEITAAGKTVVEHARIVLHQLNRMQGDLSEYSRGMKGHVRLLCNTVAMMELLPEALSTFLANHHSIDIDLEERPCAEIVKAVAEGSADLGIVTESVETGVLETFPFRPDRLVAVVARVHPLAVHREVAFADLLDFDFIGLAEGSALQSYLSTNAIRAGKPLKYRVRLQGFDAVCRMVECGVGIGIIPETAASRYQKTMSIKKLRLADAWATRVLKICVRRFDDLQPYAQQLIDQIRAPDRGFAEAQEGNVPA